MKHLAQSTFCAALRRRCLVAAVCHLLAAIVLLASISRPASAGEADDLRFLARHWRQPLAPQGTPPATYSPLEASLLPKDCGACHPVQFRDWQTTLHSKAIGPGVAGQLVDMLPGDPGQAAICLRCHAPLHEQTAFISADGSFAPNPVFNAALQQHGLTCAGCHVRQWKVFGPPRRPGVAAPPPIPTPVRPQDNRQIHDGVQRTSAYENSAFCKGCHQFDADGFALNGKLLENTYNEWAAGPYAKEGRHCQSCHMPDRRHLWRGIHDPEMVRQAILVKVMPTQRTYQPGELVRVKIAVRNIGAGHYFPTYVTPKVFVRAKLVRADGSLVEGSEQVATIGREITLDLSREAYDTRIAPRQEINFTYASKLPEPGVTLQVRVVVEPDHFYEKFFQSVLANNQTQKGRTLLQQALQATRASHFTVFSQDIPIS